MVRCSRRQSIYKKRINCVLPRALDDDLNEELVVQRSVSFGVRSRKLSNVGQSLDRIPKNYYLELLRASEGTLSRWFQLHFQSLPPTNTHWARVVDYGSFSLCVIHKESLYPSSGDINRLMMRALKCDVKKGLRRHWFNCRGYVQAVRRRAATSSRWRSCCWR
jgi:hypothetical protein